MSEFAADDPDIMMLLTDGEFVQVEKPDPFGAAVPEKLDRSVEAIANLGCLACDAENQDGRQ